MLESSRSTQEEHREQMDTDIRPGRRLGYFTRSAAPIPLTGEFDEIFTANRRVARACNTRHSPLAVEARRLLAQNGLGLCPQLKARRLLRQACSEAGLNDPTGLSELYLPMISEAQHANLTAAELAQTGARGERIATLLHRFNELLEAQRLVTSGQLFWRAAETVTTARRIAVVGYTFLGRGELEFIDALAAPGSLVLLPDTDSLPGSGANRYSENRERTGVRLTARQWLSYQTETPPLQQAALSAVTYPDEWAEVRAVLADAKQLITSGTRPDDILLLTRAEDHYGPIVQTVAWEYELPVSSYHQVKLSNTRAGELLRLLTQTAAGNFPLETTVRLTRHAFGPRLSPEQWRQARQSGANSEASWRAHGLDTHLLSWPHRATAADYATLTLNCLAAWRKQRRPAQDAHDALALQTIEDRITELPQLYPTGHALLLSEWQNDIDELLNISTVPAAPARGGLELHTPLSVSGATYDHVYLLGAVEGKLPPERHDDPVLPWHLRQRISGLESISAAVNREYGLIRSALASASKSVQVSVPLRYGGRETSPAAIVEELGLGRSLEAGTHRAAASTEEARQQTILHPDHPGGDILQEARRALKVEQHRHSSQPFDAHDGITNLPVDVSDRTFSVSQLSLLGQCPFRWFARYVLGLGPDDDWQATPDPLTIGSLYHDVLDRALTNLKDAGETDLRSNFTAAIPTAFEQVETSLGRDRIDLRTLPDWHLARTEHIDTLTRAAESEDFWAGEPLASEVPFTVDWRGIKVRGRMDRIDRSESGLTIVDLKSGSHIDKIQDSTGKLDHDLQLPLYREAAAEQYPDEPNIDTRYFSIRQAKVLTAKAPTEDDLLEFLTTTRARLAQGHFPIEPDQQQKACHYCDYRTVCRVGRRQEHKPRWTGEQS